MSHYSNESRCVAGRLHEYLAELSFESRQQNTFIDLLFIVS
jgi:hypothetical protein